MADVIPSSLAVNLKSFQKTSHQYVRVNSDRSQYPSASVINFRLPSTGIVDLDSLHICGEIAMTHTAAVTLTTPPTNMCMFRRVELLIGGYAIGSSCADYGFCTYLLRAYTSNKMRLDYQQTLGLQGAVTVSSIIGTTSYQLAWSDFIGALGCPLLWRYIPLSLFPEISLNIYLHDRSRWTVEDNSAITSLFVLQNMRLQYINVQSEGSLIENLWAQRLSSAPIVIPIQDVRYYEGSTTSATTNTFTIQVAGTSIDFVGATYRRGDYDSVVANRLLTSAGHNTAQNTVTNQMFVSGMPLSTYQALPVDSLMITESSLGGTGNSLYAPDAGTLAQTFQTFAQSFFLHMHRMEFSTNDVVDPRGWLTGLNTKGVSVPIDLILQGGDAVAKKPVIITVGKSLLTLGAGKQVTFTP